MNGGHGLQNGATLCLLKNPASACNIVMVGFEFGDSVTALHLRGVRARGLLIHSAIAISHISNRIMRPHVGRNVQELFFTHQIDLLPWPACSPHRQSKKCGPCLHERSGYTPSYSPDQLW
ncbi:hypothetical protein TNCV_3293521 [Trichonephila clavipes]|nr:hypothetical protein TNCV_3293521 [Trichonephila clavipes]